MSEEEAARPRLVAVTVAKIVTAFVAGLVGIVVTYALELLALVFWGRAMGLSVRSVIDYHAHDWTFQWLTIAALIVVSVAPIPRVNTTMRRLALGGATLACVAAALALTARAAGERADGGEPAQLA